MFDLVNKFNMLSLPQDIVNQIPRLDKDKVDTIVVHCTDTAVNNTLTIADIDGWHKARGFKCIGYHYVIRPDGMILVGRPDSLVGAHCSGENSHTIGVCYVGGRNRAGSLADTRTFAQKISLAAVFGIIIRDFPNVQQIVGHNDLSTKWCPCFNAKAEYANFVSKYRVY